ncbi:MAG TPA: amino acid ABC transporter permease [Acholeplasmataceae bacterium]|nr:amino acid ABC transporter permease [Acholeplasmataceae bacterium]
MENIIKLIIKYFPIFLEGTSVTIVLALIAVFFGTILGSLLAFAKISNNKILSKIASIYIEVFRGIPLLLQLWVIYLLTYSTLGKFIAVSFALLLNSAAYVAEIVRSGIDAVDVGQMEAARSLGLSRSFSMRKIIFPQAIKNILPALGNEFVAVIKETSLASVFYIGDLMTVKNTITTLTYLSLEPYIIIGCIYLFLTFTISKLIKRLEVELNND